MITVLNWAFYQNHEQQNKHQLQQTNNKRTTDEQQLNTNKNRKNRITEEALFLSSARARPDLETVIGFAKEIGLAEWKANDSWLEMEGVGWLDTKHRPVEKWKAFFRGVKSQWVKDGSPLQYRRPSQNRPVIRESNQRQEKIEAKRIKI